MADVPATVVTFTVDRLAYSPSPPIVFAVVDFDGGGRFPVELTDVDPDALAIGSRTTTITVRVRHRLDCPATPTRSGFCFTCAHCATQRVSAWGRSPSAGWAKEDM